MRRRRRPPAIGLRSPEGTRSARSPAKLSEVARPSATSSESACSTWVRSSPAPAANSSKNDAPLSRMNPATASASRLSSVGSAFSAKRAPKRRMSAGKQSDRRSAHRAYSSRACVERGRDARPQARPGDAARQALVVQPGALVVGHTRGKDFAFPSARRRLETFELRKGRSESFRAFAPRIGAHVLPCEQEAQEIARRDGFYFRAQALQRVAVNAGEQSALAPFFAVRAGREAAAHRKPFGLERCERGGDLAGLQAERRGERDRRDRPQPFEASTQDLDQRGLLRDGRLVEGPAGKGAAKARGSAAAVPRRPRFRNCRAQGAPRGFPPKARRATRANS